MRKTERGEGGERESERGRERGRDTDTDTETERVEDQKTVARKPNEGRLSTT